MVFPRIKTEVGAEIMTLKHFICLCFVGIGVAVSCPKEGASRQSKDAPAGATRVALVSTDGKEVVRNVLDLAEAELGSATKIEILERRQIERVLSEQKLSLSGLVEANQIVAAGKLLSVDLFSVVETAAGGKEALGLVVFQAQTGVRLWDAPLPAGEAKQVAKALATRVHQAVEKSRSAPRQMTPLCLLGVRNADLPRELDSFCESVGLMLERRLLGSPSIVVLERKRLDYLNQEKSLPKEDAQKELLASLYLLELEVSRAKKGAGLRARALVTDSKGKKLADVTAQTGKMDAAGLVDPLLQEVLRGLRAAPARDAGDRIRESNRFLREAQLLWNHKLWREGLRAMECAPALDPSNRNNAALLAEYLLHYAVALVDPKGINVLAWASPSTHKIAVDPPTLTTALKLAQRGIELQNTDLLQLGSRERQALSWHSIRHMGARRALRSFLNKLLYVEVKSPESREALDSFRAAVEHAILDECNAWAEGVTKHPGQGDNLLKGTTANSFFSQYSHVFRESIEFLKWNATDGSAFEKALAQAGQQWVKAAGRQGLETFQIYHLTWFLEDLIRSATSSFGATWPLQPSDLAPLREVFDVMQKHRHPLIALYGQCGSVLVGLKTKQLAPGNCREHYEKMKQQAWEWINDPPIQRGANDFRAGCYKALAFALDNLDFGPDAAAKPAEYFALCDFMFGRKELVDEVVIRALSWKVPTPELETKRLELLNRALALADQPECRVLSGHKQHVKDVLWPVRDKLLAGAAPQGEVPWDKARKVFDIKELKDIQALQAPTVMGEHVYLVGCGLREQQGFIQLVRITLADGSAKLLGKTDVTLKRYGPGRISWGSFVNPPFVRGIVVDEDTVYVGTRNDGIYAFGPSGTVRRLDEKQGFPSTEVEGLAFLAAKLYAALSDGYLVAYESKAERVEVLASSRRKEKRAPFDDLKTGFSVPFVVADPQHDRLLLAVYEKPVLPPNRPDPAKEPVSGFWELNVKTNTFKRHVRFSNFSHASFAGPIRGNHLLLSSNTWALDYDLARDKPDLLWAFNPVGPDLGTDKARCKDYFGMSPPRWYHEGWLWTDRPFGRTSLASKRQQRFPPLGKPRDLNPFQPREAIEPLGKGDQVLIADLYTLWVVSLRKEKAK
jgi:hypothetical protein